MAQICAGRKCLGLSGRHRMVTRKWIQYIRHCLRGHAWSVSGIENIPVTDVPVTYDPDCPKSPDGKTGSGSVRRAIGHHTITQQDTGNGLPGGTLCMAWKMAELPLGEKRRHWWRKISIYYCHYLSVKFINFAKNKFCTWKYSIFPTRTARIIV